MHEASLYIHWKLPSLQYITAQLIFLSAVLQLATAYIPRPDVNAHFTTKYHSQSYTLGNNTIATRCI